jgi:hypothetical protein
MTKVVVFAALALVVTALADACGGDRSLHVPHGAAGTSTAGTSAAGSGGIGANASGVAGDGSTDPSGGGGTTSDDPCAVGRARYDELRAQFLAKSDVSLCKADSDCSIVDLSNRCDNQCGGTAIFKGLAADFASTLSDASQECDSCPTVSPGCFLRDAVCSNGRCIRAIPPSYGVTLACQDARDAYMIDRGALITMEEAFECHADADCAIVVEVNGCINNCGTPVPASATTSYSASLQADADQCNAQCPPLPTVCPNGIPTCEGGRCGITPTGFGMP